MIDTVTQISPGCEIVILKGPAYWKVNILGFVDNKRHYGNNTSFVFAKELITVMEK